MSTVDPIPSGYPRVTPYLHVDGASDAIDFYTSILGATERMRMFGAEPDVIVHAELQLGDSIIMLSDEAPDMGVVGPRTIGGSPVALHVYLEGVDAVHERAVAAGARSLREPADEFYGDRVASFEDPFGHRWSVATHVEDVSEEEMQRRMSGSVAG